MGYECEFPYGDKRQARPFLKRHEEDHEYDDRQRQAEGLQSRLHSY